MRPLLTAPLRAHRRSALAGATALALVFAVAVAAPAGPAAAEDGEAFPRIDVEVDAELEFEGAVASTDTAANTDELFTTTEPAIAIRPVEWFAIEAGLVAEPVTDLDPGEARFFGDHGFFVEVLQASVSLDAATLFGGKINPTFGVAWDIAPGQFGTGPAEDFYEQVERIGGGASIVFGEGGIGGGDLGTHTLTGQTFFADTSVLSESVFTNRGRVSLGDGGVANTEDLSSFSVTLDGEGVALGGADVAYHLGVVRNAAGATETEAELGFAIALYGGVDIAEGVRFEPLIEYVRFDGAEGVDQSRDIITVAGATLVGDWNYALSYTGVFSDPDAPGIEDLDFQQFQATLGYDFGRGLNLDGGYNLTREEVDGDVTTSHFLGFLLAWNFGFSATPQGFERPE